MIIQDDGFIHHVYFWLKEPENEMALLELTEGLKKLSEVTRIKEFHIGKPASTRREVIDSSFSVSWLVLFNNKEDQDSYQNDPIHLKFVEECSQFWRKVLVYDTIGIGQNI
jgi:hypothetical protein